jgi:ABC-type glutathione transport system ATPase component
MKASPHIEIRDVLHGQITQVGPGLNGGRVVESGPTLHVIQHAEAPYTQELLDAIPNPVTRS